MTDAMTKPDLHQMIAEGRRQRSLAVWQMFAAIRALPGRIQG